MIDLKRPLLAVLITAPLLGAPLSTTAQTPPAQSNSARTIPASVTLNDAYAPDFAQWYETVMPGAALSIRLAPGQDLLIGETAWTPNWRAPQEAQTLSARLTDSGETIAEVTIFVLESAAAIDDRGWLNGYRIGQYPKDAPAGFIRLNGPEDRNTKLSPHFKLGQFLCKQQPDHWPKYVLVSQDNIRRLEALLTALNADQTTEAKTFFVMSGFRTPYYNTAIGSAKYSRHMYGDAADIYVDWAPRNGNMDDLNRDGKVNKADANWLYDYAQRLFKSRDDLPKGGIGAYKANAVHGPFVHVDGRGRPARWGRG